MTASPLGLLVGEGLLFSGRDGEPDLSSAKVAVLQSQQTASAAEHVLVAFSERANTRSFGEKSAGLTSLNGLFNLSDGSALLLSIGFLQSAGGVRYTDAIIPDVDYSAARQQDAHSPEDAAMSWLTTNCPG